MPNFNQAATLTQQATATIPGLASLTARFGDLNAAAILGRPLQGVNYDGSGLTRREQPLPLGSGGRPYPANGQRWPRGA
jgi:hypothetical protein